MQVAFANLLCLNPWPARSLRALAAGQADVVAVAEASPGRVDALAAALPFHHLVLTVPSDGRCRILLFSAWPLVEAEVVADGACADRPFGRARLEGPAGFTVIAAHATCPLGRDSRDRRDRQIERLAEEVAAVDGAVILLGDLNADDGSDSLRPLRQQAGMLSPRTTPGHHPTWPWPWPRRTYDHILHSPHFRCEHLEARRLLGSDHLGLRARLRWARRCEKPVGSG